MQKIKIKTQNYFYQQDGFYVALYIFSFSTTW